MSVLKPRKLGMLASCSYSYDTPIVFTDWRWHVIARNLGLGSVNPAQALWDHNR